MGKKIDVAALPTIIGTLYPPPFDAPCQSRERTRLGDAAGLTQFGVNLLRLPAGAWSSQRHWHTAEDEFVYVVSGEVTLVTDAGPETLRAGDSAGFKAGEADGHCLQNRSAGDALVLEIGTRIGADAAHYSDIDLLAPAAGKPTILEKMARLMRTSKGERRRPSTLTRTDPSMRPCSSWSGLSRPSTPRARTHWRRRQRATAWMPGTSPGMTGFQRVSHSPTGANHWQA